MKKLRMSKMIAILIACILLSNIPAIKNIVSFIVDNHYRYSNYDGTFTFIEIKSRDVSMMYRKTRVFNESQPLKKDSTIYRIFNKNPLAFWRWAEYFYDKRYKLPYKSWKEIRKRRGYDLKYSNSWQDF
jgi:hypothetical protein